VAVLLAASRAGLVAAARLLVHRCPGTAFGLFVADTAILIAFLDMLGLALLLVGIFILVALGHHASPVDARRPFKRILIMLGSQPFRTSNIY
jgi:hypothetical protein